MSQKVNARTLEAYQDSARIYHWDVVIEEMEGLAGASEAINLRATSVSQPNPDYNIIQTDIRGFTKVESGAVTWQPISLNVVEVDDYTVLNALWTLGQKQFDATTGVQSKKSEYTGRLNIFLQSMADGNATKFGWQMIGCVIQNIQPPEMTADKGSIVEIPLDIMYDYAIYTTG